MPNPHLNKLLTQFKEKLKHLDHVAKIESETRIHLSIEVTMKAPPWQDSYRKPIYEAERELLKELTDKEEVTFTIINPNEENYLGIRPADY